MKKIKNILALLVVALMGLSLTACSEDDLDTNQYQKGVHLNVYGPQPVMRGGQLRFLGSNLDQIAQVLIPGCEPITNIEVVKAGFPSEIRITLPKDGPEPGLVTLITKTDERITTKTALTYQEGIEFEAFSPESVMPGEELTIKGEYLNLVHMIEFADGVRVPESAFTEHTRYEIKVIVPDEARTGKVGLFDVDLSTLEDAGSAIYNIIMTDVALNVGTPTISKVTTPRGEGIQTDEFTAKMDELFTLNGEHFGLINSIKFVPKAGDVHGSACETTEFTVSEDGKTLTFKLPAEAADGDINLVCRSGEEVPVGSLITIAPTECVASPNPVKAGKSLIITGKDLDVVNAVEMTGVADEISFITNPDGTKLIIESIPETAVEGNLILRMKNGKGVEVPFSLVKPVVTGYDHNPVSAGGAITLQGTNLDLVKKVQFGEGSDIIEVKASEDGTSISLTVPMNAKTGKPTLTLANGTTVECPELNIEEAVFCYITELPDFSEKEKTPEAGGTFTVPVKNGDKLESVLVNGKNVNFVYAEKPSSLTIGIPADASAKSVLKLVSSNGSVEYDIAVIPQGTVTRTLWIGSIDLANWTGNTQGTLAVDALDNLPAGANVELKIQYTATADQIQLKGNTGDWTAVDLDNGEYKEHVYELDPNAKEFTIPLSATTIAALKAKATNWGGLIIFGGKGAILTKISAEISIPLETTIWNGTFNIVKWNGMKDLSWDGYDWSTVKAGTTLRLYYNKINAGGWACISLRSGTSWNNLPAPIASQYDLNEDEGKVEVSIAANVLQDLIDNHGLVVTGDNCTLTKITLE
nr:hypothetical protein [Prevotella sp.]